MIFSSVTFLAFFTFVFFIHWYVIPFAVPERYRLRVLHVFLLVVSYYFYMSWEWRFGFLIASTTVWDYTAGRLMDLVDEKLGDSERGRRLRKRVLMVSVVTNLGLLGYFKYTDFFIGSFVEMANAFAPGTFSGDAKESLLLHLVLPLGISFFTFQSMTYTIDVYRRIIPVEKDFLRFSLFVSFFPQLVAGPIVTAKEFLPQLGVLPRFDLERMRVAGRWFLLGFIKKAVLADNMAPIVDQIYAHPDQWGLVGHWIGALGFWIQIYGDFSGYSDMAWGAAIFLGYVLPENFRMPYLSTSVSEHWRRWHISLMRWLRDYLYIPLGGNRVSFWRHKFNQFAVMFLGGLWHGASWTYVIWGSIHGILLGVEAAWKEYKKKRGWKDRPLLPWKIGLALSFLATSFITIYLGTIFRARNISDAWIILRRMVGFDPIVEPVITASLYRPVLLGVIVIYAGHYLGKKIFDHGTLRRQPPAWLEVLLLPVAIVAITQLMASGTAAFIYFVF